MRAIIKESRIFIYDSYAHKESIKGIPGRYWHVEEKAWSVPLNIDNIETLNILGCILPDELLEFLENVDEYFENPVLIPAPLKVTPYEHQLKGYNLACRSMGIIENKSISPGFALLMEMGTGKTITSIAIAGRAFMSGKIKRLLILAPKSIVTVWEDEFSKFADFPYSLSVLKGSSVKKIQALKSIPNKGLEVAVVNYDSIALIEKELLTWQPDMIICDESSKIKNPTAKMSKATHKIAKLAIGALIAIGVALWMNWDSVCAWCKSAFQAVGDFFVSVGNGIASFFTGLWNGITGFLSGAWNTISSAATSVFTGIGTAISNVWNGIVGAVKGAINGIISAINSMIRGAVSGINGLINGINKVTGAVGIPSIPTFTAPQIPMLANGGMIRTAGSVIVGEKGPEILSLPQGAKVTPIDKSTKRTENKWTINIYADGKSVDEILDELVPRLKLAIENM